MAITLYNPKTKAFFAFTAPESDLPLAEVLQMNILIELQVISQYLAENSADAPEDLRTDIVSNL